MKHSGNPPNLPEDCPATSQGKCCVPPPFLAVVLLSIVTTT